MLEFRNLTPNMANQVDKVLRNDVETGLCRGL